MFAVFFIFHTRKEVRGVVMDERNIPVEIKKTDEIQLERLKKYYNVLKKETELTEEKND